MSPRQHGKRSLIDEKALLAALDAGIISSASLDVLLEEPPAGNTASAALASHHRVLATPHVAYLSTRAVQTLRRNAALHAREMLT
jgi:phosphoglycerate dehydrogenase-like enzyme